MVFSVREGICGLNHLFLKTSRLLFKKPATLYLERYASSGAEPVLDQNGSFACCEICGFALIKAKFESGWCLQMCSALPIISLNDPEFQSWFQKLAEANSRTDTCTNSKSNE